MDRTIVGSKGGRWYRRLQVQLWLWAVLPLLLVIAAFTFTGVYGHKQAMRAFVGERHLTMAGLYAQQVDDALAHGTVRLDGTGLVLVLRDGRVGNLGVIYVVDEQGLVLFYPGFLHIGERWLNRPAVRQALSTESGTVSGSLQDGTETLASFATVGETGWRVVLEEPVSEIIVPILRFSSVLPVVIAAAGVLSLLLLYFTWRSVVRPIQQLAGAAERITWGELEELQIQPRGVEEVRQLSRALHDMLERIRGYQRSMRDYVAAMMQGQEAERARLSHELHDDTVQNWIAAGQRLRLTQRALEQGDQASALLELEETRALASSAVDELRRLIRGLRPAYLEDLGLLPALEALVQETQDQGLPAHLTVDGEVHRSSPEVELSAYRIAQEALANVTQHANAQQVGLTLSFKPGHLELSVQDDGQGFSPPADPQAMTEAGHFGLIGMRERALLVGGSLEVRSSPGQGTRIVASFPLPQT